MPIQIGQPLESDFRNPLGLLSDCHRRIERFLNVLQSIAQEVNGEELNDEQRRAFEVALKYFRDAAPKHTLDEEDSLFPRMRNKQNSALSLLEELHSDHESADRLHHGVDRLGLQWLAQGQLPPDDVKLLIEMITRLSETYARHIAIEDNQLFPLAATLLNRNELTAIAQEMAVRRGLGAAS